MCGAHSTGNVQGTSIQVNSTSSIKVLVICTVIDPLYEGLTTVESLINIPADSSHKILHLVFTQGL